MMTISDDEIKKALKIKNAIQHYLEMTKEVNIRTTDVFPYLVRRGIFGADKHNGLYFRRFLKRLYKANMLRSLIPQCTYVPGINGEIFGEWYFNIHKLEEVRGIKEEDMEESIVPNLINSLSYEEAKENLWQLTQGVNPLSGEPLNEIEDKSLILISRSLNIFMNADKTSEEDFKQVLIEQTQEENPKTSLISKSEEEEEEEESAINTSHKNYIEKIRVTHPNAYNPWDMEEDSMLKHLYNKNYKVIEIAEKLKRQPGAIRSRLKKNGLLD